LYLELSPRCALSDSGGLDWVTWRSGKLELGTSSQASSFTFEPIADRVGLACSCSELQREKVWSRIHLVPLLMAEADRDVYRREQAALAREKEIMKDVPGWEVSTIPSVALGLAQVGPALGGRIAAEWRANRCWLRTAVRACRSARRLTTPSATPPARSSSSKKTDRRVVFEWNVGGRVCVWEMRDEGWRTGRARSDACHHNTGFGFISLGIVHMQVHDLDLGDLV